MESEPGTKARIVVIGAGMGGLAAAIRLAAAGQTVTLIDAQATPGGKMRAISSPATSAQWVRRRTTAKPRDSPATRTASFISPKAGSNPRRRCSEFGGVRPLADMSDNLSQAGPVTSANALRSHKDCVTFCTRKLWRNLMRQLSLPNA